MIDLLIVLVCIIAYATIARMVYSWHVETEYPNHSHSDYCDHFISCVIGTCFPFSLIYFLMLRYPFRLSDHIGKYLGNRQLKRANVRLQKQLAIRQELEEVNRQAKLELATLEQELINDPLEQQFSELKLKQTNP